LYILLVSYINHAGAADHPFSGRSEAARAKNKPPEGIDGSTGRRVAGGRAETTR
jgi:hypothetical protein